MIKAVGKNIIAKAVLKETKVPIILTTNEPTIDHYKVLSVGEDIQHVMVGDEILVFQYGVKTIKDGDEELSIISPENVYAKR